MTSTLVAKEFTSRLQGKLTYVLLTLIALLFTGLILAAFWMLVVSVPTIVPVIGSSASASGSASLQSVVASNRGAFLFYALAMCLLAAVFTVTPAVAASAISSERENATFDLLLASGVPSGAIVRGKLLAAVLFVLLLASTAVPGFAVAWMFGGVSWLDVALTAVVVVACVMFVSAVGLLCSTLARSSTIAALYTYAVVYLIALGSLTVYLIGAALQNETAVRPLLAVNPFVTLATIPDSLVPSLQQTLPYQYRGALDTGTVELLGWSLRVPRWLITCVLYGGIALATGVLASALLDPCHPWRSRGERARG